ncbi:polysaccharide deacetylase family protein [Enterococcus sp. LJL51]|uniref:polysaccharide deacetylase family protein n=1 Tax=Enterococcus sp. LJL51 TaxID=3416656 RepID=UPI003CF7249F
MFRTLVFHEVRPAEELTDSPRPILVSDGYQDALPLPLFDSLPLFEEKMNYLKEQGYHTLSIEEVKAFYEKQQPLPEKSVLLTFDDCFQSLKEHAYPVLKKAGFNAVVFAPTGWLFDEPAPYQAEVSRALSKPELEEMKDVFVYANHTNHFHQRRGRELSRPMWETPAAFAEDLAECNTWVDLKDVFAYPFGLYDQTTVDSLKKLNYTLAFTTIPGINTEATSPLELRRDVIPYTLSLNDFKKMMETKGE